MKHLKHLLALLLVCAVLLTGLSLVSAATPRTGKCGKNAAWTLQEGTLTISGKGNIYNYSFDTLPPWLAYREEIDRIVIEEGIKHIGNFAFEECRQAKSIKLPTSLRSIGDDAFFECTQLNRITLFDGVKKIGDGAFERCHALKEMIFPDSIEKIGVGAIFYCSSLEYVVLPAGLTEIPAGMFGRCPIEEVKIPKAVTSIGEMAFDNCGIKKIDLPEGLRVIEECAFMRNRLTKVTIPASVKYIGPGAFGMGVNLKTLTILNPECVIAEDVPEAQGGQKLVPEMTMLRGYSGSTTERYAKERSLKFKALADSAGLSKVSGLKITTGGKAKTLKLTWNAVKGAKGYQVLRSTTGKSGSYKRIAVIKKPGFTDTGLKNSTAYYYAVRAYRKSGENYVYGEFAKTNLSTKITVSYAEKLTRNVYRVADDWLRLFWFDEYSESRQNEKPITAKYNGRSGETSGNFYKVNHPKIKTMAQLKSFLLKTFTKETVEDITSNYYKEFDGELYRYESIEGDELTVVYPSKNKVEFTKVTDKRIDMIMYLTREVPTFDEKPIKPEVTPCNESLYYQNGRWVFGKDVDGYSWGYGMWYLDGDDDFKK